MAHAKFTAEVLTPEGQVFDDEVEMVSTRTTSSKTFPSGVRTSTGKLFLAIAVL